MTDPIDWNEIWNRQMELASRKWDDEYFWYERTQLPPIGIKTSNYADELINLMELSSEDSVLDIGCGDGAIAIRIAKQVRQVTALDTNPNLLFPITQRAVAEGITNLKFQNIDWLQAQIGSEIHEHDIVLASRFRQITNLRRFLEQMHLAAKKCCYLTWIAEREEMDKRICEVLGLEYHPLPEYSIIVSMLQNLGIDVHIDMFETIETYEFQSEQDAVENAIRGYRIENLEKLDQIVQLVTSGLECLDGWFLKNTFARWALIWWEK